MRNNNSNTAVIIRDLRMDDKTDMARLLNNKKILDGLSNRIPYPYSENDALRFIDYIQNEKTEKAFAVEFNGVFCGVTGLILPKDTDKKSAEIGYWIGEPFWGKGIATEAVRQLTRYGFDTLQLLRIYASVFDFNRASMKVLEKNAFIKEEIRKKAVLKNGKYLDEHRYFKLNPKTKEI